MAVSIRSLPPCRAASTASSSYALMCAIRPRCSGPTGSSGTGTGPAEPISAGTSTTASSGRNGSVPRLRTLTTWVSPVPLVSEASRATAASE